MRRRDPVVDTGGGGGGAWDVISSKKSGKNHLDEESANSCIYKGEKPFHSFLLIANHYHPYNQFMLLLPPSA